MALPKEPEETLVGYLRNSRRYWRQALAYIEKGDLEKASELAWGCVAERIKALALVRDGRLIKSHREIRDYIKDVSQDTGNKAIFDAYRQAQGLHSNFYESGLDADEVKDSFLETEKLILDIDRLMESS